MNGVSRLCKQRATKLSLATCNLSRAIQLKRATAGEFQHMKKALLLESHGSVGLTGARTHESCICRDCLPLPLSPSHKCLCLTDYPAPSRDTSNSKFPTVSIYLILNIPNFFNYLSRTIRINLIVDYLVLTV